MVLTSAGQVFLVASALFLGAAYWLGRRVSQRSQPGSGVVKTYTAGMQCKPFKLLANVVAGWLLAAGMALGQTLGLAYTSAEAQSYGNVPVPELVYARFGKSQDPLIREQVAQGMLNKANALSQSGEAAESAATYDLVYERFGQDPAPNVLVQVLKALINKGYDLGQRQQLEAEREVYALIDREYGQRQELVLKEKLADALFNTCLLYTSPSPRD